MLHRECGKVLANTADDEEEEEVWVEDEDTCVDLEKTQCTVQEREAETDSDEVEEDTKEVLKQALHYSLGKGGFTGQPSAFISVLANPVLKC